MSCDHALDSIDELMSDKLKNSNCVSGEFRLLPIHGFLMNWIRYLRGVSGRVSVGAFFAATQLRWDE